MTRGGVAVVHLARGRDWRGGERQVRLLVRMLRAHAEFAQHVVTDAESALARALREDGLTPLDVAWSRAYDPRTCLGIVGHLHRLRRDGTRLLLHAHDSHAVTFGLVASLLVGAPLVATRRSITPASRQWRRPARIIAVSDAVRQVLLENGVPAARISVVRSAIDLTRLERPEVGSPPATPYLIAVGALTNEKGHATLIDAFSQLAVRWPDLRLLILGDGPARHDLGSRAERLGLGNRIELMGEVTAPAGLIARAAVFVQPSHREALGTAVLHAMALDTPVVASRTGGLPELLGHGAGLLVRPGDSTALAAAVDTLLSDPARRADLARTARGRVGEFDAVGMAERVVQVYRSALGDT